MGRKPKRSKINVMLRSHSSEKALPYGKFAEGSSENINQTKELNSQPMSSPSMQMNQSVADVEANLVRTAPHGQVNQVGKHRKKYATVSRKMLKCGASVRRSERIKSGVANSPNPKQGAECIVDVTVSDSEVDELETQAEQVLPRPKPTDTQIELLQVLPPQNTQVERVLPQPNAQTEQALPESQPDLSEKGLDEKVEYALQEIKALHKIIELLKSKVDGNVNSCEAPSTASFSYRTMYIDSQKKIEALSKENQQLKEELENALGKVEMCEKENGVLSELLNKMKDTVNQQLSNVAKTTEAAVFASTQEIDNAYSVSAAKRKKNEG
ncbi:uncharacterized protein LOC131621608 [Vicia villosa]|uniref:uncharacterized protein LOC131621608 n=1 Tax=Vicia villosa TaxID=3911 RepID=UPI00273A8A13|nr:uncharacterized protein LOC131621608 [Vicia villosa]